MVGSNKLTSTFGLMDIVMHYQGKISKLVQAQNNKYIYIYIDMSHIYHIQHCVHFL